MERAENQNKPRVFITGASSLLMRSFMSRIDLDQYSVSVLTRDKLKFQDANFNVIEGDIIDGELMNECVDGHDIIIHAAGLTHSFKTQPYFDVNSKATRKMVDAAAEKENIRFVYVSSRAAVKGAGAYGESKLEAENYVRNNVGNWLVFRPGEVFGSKAGEGIDQLIQDVKTKGMVLCPGGLKDKMYPIHVDDTARIMADYCFGTNINDTVTIDGKEGYTYRDLIKLIAKVFNKKVAVLTIPKFLMNIIGVMLKITGFKGSIVPDQIPRLYVAKEHGQSFDGLKSLESFLKEID